MLKRYPRRKFNTTSKRFVDAEDEDHVTFALLFFYQISEMSAHANELVSEIEELKGTVARQKQEHKKLTCELSELEQRTQGYDK